VAQSASTATSVYPASITTSQGENFTISVTVSSVTDPYGLYGWEFRMSWNSTLADEVNVTEGPFLKSGGSTFFTYKVNATAGNMIADCTLSGNIPGVQGTGTLANVTFHAGNVGESPLDLHNVTLIDSNEQTIPISQTTGGYVYVNYPHDVAVAAVSFSPTTVLPGVLVKINVTAENLGGYLETFNVTAYANSKSVGKKNGVSLASASSTNVTIVWNTTGYGFGDYAISGSVSIVPGETNTGNNIKVANNTLTILYPGHQIAIVAVKSSKTVLGQGLCMFITVTAKNYGIFNETFTTTVYANTSAIQTQEVTLQSANSAVLSFIWNATNFAKGNYTIKAYAPPVSGEHNTTDNILSDGHVVVSIKGDITGPKGVPDGKVDMYDVALFAESFGSTPGSPRWNPNCDLTGPKGVPDGHVKMDDIALVAGMFGKKAP
jgi:hypothetical protein